MSDDDAVFIRASEDPADIPITLWQQAQWHHIQGDEVGLMELIQKIHRDAYLQGFAAWANPPTD